MLVKTWKLLLQSAYKQRKPKKNTAYNILKCTFALQLSSTYKQYKPQARPILEYSKKTHSMLKKRKIEVKKMLL